MLNIGHIVWIDCMWLVIPSEASDYTYIEIRCIIISKAGDPFLFTGMSVVRLCCIITFPYHRRLWIWWLQSVYNNLITSSVITMILSNLPDPVVLVGTWRTSHALHIHYVVIFQMLCNSRGLNYIHLISMFQLIIPQILYFPCNKS